MKKIWYPLLSVGLLAVSCDYLEKPKGTDITEETIFSTQNNIETFVTGTYYYGSGFGLYLPRFTQQRWRGLCPVLR